VVDAYIHRVVDASQDEGDELEEVRDNDDEVGHSAHPDPLPLDLLLRNGDGVVHAGSLVEEAHGSFHNMVHDEILEVEVDSKLLVLPSTVDGMMESKEKDQPLPSTTHRCHFRTRAVGRHRKRRLEREESTVDKAEHDTTKSLHGYQNCHAPPTLGNPKVEEGHHQKVVVHEIAQACKGLGNVEGTQEEDTKLRC
jgi:hypothetical protein